MYVGSSGAYGFGLGSVEVPGYTSMSGTSLIQLRYFLCQAKYRVVDLMGMLRGQRSLGVCPGVWHHRQVSFGR